jgi:hypothetical protein
MAVTEMSIMWSHLNYVHDFLIYCCFFQIFDPSHIFEGLENTDTQLVASNGYITI